ncbi:hypothetical protein GOODEAATRI_029726 [Goodea atripinnis]|uniref:Uncharacterized protein n=1 Tax=Goodea atripinnis TaxID=208336 RepID=A0ABV0PSS6_9TELE
MPSMWECKSTLHAQLHRSALTEQAAPSVNRTTADPAPAAAPTLRTSNSQQRNISPCTRFSCECAQEQNRPRTTAESAQVRRASARETPASIIGKAQVREGTSKMSGYLPLYVKLSAGALALHREMLPVTVNWERETEIKKGEGHQKRRKYIPKIGYFFTLVNVTNCFVKSASVNENNSASQDFSSPPALAYVYSQGERRAGSIFQQWPTFCCKCNR